MFDKEGEESTIQFEYTIEQDTLEVQVTAGSVPIYDGETHEPTAIIVTGQTSGETLTEDDEHGYTVSYETEDGQLESDKPKGAGNYTIVITLQGDAETNYIQPEVSNPYVIDPKKIEVRFTDFVNVIYNGTDWLNTVKSSYVSFHDPIETLESGDYEITVNTSSNNDRTSMTKAGTYTVAISLSDTETARNYSLTGTTTHGYEIKKANLSVSVSNTSKTYNRAEQIPTITITGASGDTSFRENNSANGYTVSYATVDGQLSNGKPFGAGTYDINIILHGDAETNYDVSNPVDTFTIEKARLKAELSKSDTTYDGADHAQEILEALKAAIAANTPHPEEDGYTITIDGAKSAEVKNVKTGGYKVKVELTSDAQKNYLFENGGTFVEYTYTVNKATNEWTGGSGNVTLANWTYGEAAHEPSAPSKFGNATFTYTHENNQSGTYFPEKPTNAGTYYVKATVAADGDNYDAIEAVVSFTIEQATIHLDSGKISVADKTYDGSETVDVSTVTYSDAVSGIISADGGVKVTVRSATLESADAGESVSVTIVFVIEGDTNNNYKFENGTAETTVSVTMNVIPATATATWKVEKPYYTTGKDLLDEIVKNIQVTATEITGSDYEITASKGGAKVEEIKEAGNYTLTVTLTNKNYRFAPEQMTAELSVEVIQTAATVTKEGISYFGTIGEAWAAATGTATVTLQIDVNASAELTVGGGTLTLDLNGRTLTGNIAVSGGSFTLGGTGKVEGTVTVSGGSFILNGGDVTKVHLQKGTSITVQDASHSGTIAIQVDEMTDVGMKVLSWTGSDPTAHFKSEKEKACYYIKEGESAAYIGKHSLDVGSAKWDGHASATFDLIRCENCNKESSPVTVIGDGISTGDRQEPTCTRDGSQAYIATVKFENLSGARRRRQYL